MVTGPKAVIASAAVNVAPTRAGPSTRVASAYNGVEELQQNAGVAFSAPSYAFNEEDHSTFKRREDGSTGRQHPGLFASPTQAFAALLEGEGTPGKKGDSPAAEEKIFSGLVSRAISIYEKNARVVAGENFVLGRTLSLVL